MSHKTVEQSMWATSPTDLMQIQKGLSQPTYLNEGLGMDDHGWIHLGTAIIQQEFKDIQDINNVAADTCDEAIAKLRADVEVKITHLQQLKQNFLALDYNPKPFAERRIDPMPDDDIPF